MDDSEELQARDHAGSILGIALGCAAYAGAHRLGRPLFHYLPEVGEWATEPPAQLVAMGYYGLVPYGLFGFVLGWAIARIPAVGAWLSTQGARRLTLAAAVAISGALLYHVGVELTAHMGG